jgi:hypothetical protein
MMHIIFQKMSLDISTFILDEGQFERMKYNDKFPEDMTFADFKMWNLQCIVSLSDEERIWLVELCKRLSQKRIRLMDEESSAVFTAENIYFDNKKNIVITNPR